MAPFFDPIGNNSMEQPYFEKLTVAQLVTKFQVLYGTRMFIIVFTKAHRCTLFWAR
jgi:hypothetical protein